MSKLMKAQKETVEKAEEAAAKAEEAAEHANSDEQMKESAVKDSADEAAAEVEITEADAEELTTEMKGPGGPTTAVCKCMMKNRVVTLLQAGSHPKKGCKCEKKKKG